MHQSRTLHKLKMLLIMCAFSLQFSNTSHAKDLDHLKLSFYGSFVHSESVPNALFFFSDIEENDSFELRKALRNHSISTLVLSSRGGSVWEGLSMAGIIHDKQLTTYVPEKGLAGEGDCASACSFMFFGGATRVVDGQLGVHQFYSGKASAKEQIGTTSKRAQFTVSEIIGFLNEFGTPPFVYERMFQQQNMYYFNRRELDKISEIGEFKVGNQTAEISKFIDTFSKALEKETLQEDKIVAKPKKVTKPSGEVQNNTQLISSIQTELNRLNCNAGRPDGVVGKKTKAAYSTWKKSAQVNLPKLVSDRTLRALQVSSAKCKRQMAKPKYSRLAIPATLSGTASCKKNGRTKVSNLRVTSTFREHSNKKLVWGSNYFFDNYAHTHTHTCNPKDSCYGKFNNDQRDGYIQIARGSVKLVANVGTKGKCTFVAQ